MPTRERHLEFDDILRYKGIICDDTDGNSVHARLDKGSKWFADVHRELDPFNSIEGIRAFVDNIVNSFGNIYPSTAVGGHFKMYRVAGTSKCTTPTVDNILFFS